MTQQEVNRVVVVYVHTACTVWRRLLNDEMDRDLGVRILLNCKNGLKRCGYSFSLIKQAGVVARKEVAA